MDVKVKAERDAQRMMHGIGFVKARQCAWAAFDYIDDLEAERDALEAGRAEMARINASLCRQIADLEAERDTLRAEVAEWFCQGCNRAYPPPAVGRLLQPCPQCDGVLVPSSQNLRELLRLRDRVKELERSASTAIEIIKDEGRRVKHWHERDLAMAEAVREACLPFVVGLYAADAGIRALDLPAIIAGVKETK